VRKGSFKKSSGRSTPEHAAHLVCKASSGLSGGPIAWQVISTMSERRGSLGPVPQGSSESLCAFTSCGEARE
jgi:hypothetical protein